MIVIRFVIKEALALVKLLLSVMQQLSRSTIWHEIASLANVRRYQIFSSDDKTIATMFSEDWDVFRANGTCEMF